MNVTINKETQGIALYNSKYKPVITTCPGYESSFATIEICEIKVMGCQSKQFGKICTLCNPKCRNGQCEISDGSCIAGCSDNVIQSEDCSECKNGFYGTDCTQKCGFCTVGTFCNKTSGICPDGCQGNWKDSKCLDCKNGFYGEACEFNCGKCSTGTFCNNITGLCPKGCEDHWNGSKCQEDEEEDTTTRIRQIQSSLRRLKDFGAKLEESMKEFSIALEAKQDNESEIEKFTEDSEKLFELLTDVTERSEELLLLEKRLEQADIPYMKTEAPNDPRIDHMIDLQTKNAGTTDAFPRTPNSGTAQKREDMQRERNSSS
ncbi:integrin beta-like protein B [Saccostrea cucullata]|uniref:integrin beta-like protein B n=1 Tax=Saccostrea cuccullata TaxID=36930 RepID=UPI002ED3382C